MPNPSKAHIFSPMQRSRTGRIECKYSIFFGTAAKKAYTHRRQKPPSAAKPTQTATPDSSAEAQKYAWGDVIFSALLR